MKYASNALVQLAGSGTGVFDKFQSWLNEVNTHMVKIGPAVAGISIAIAVLYICLSSDTRQTREQVKKIITIVVAVSLLANITLLLQWGSNIVQYFFS